MNDCILCSGRARSGPYGLKWHGGRLYRAHRLAYALHNGLDPATLGGVVMHSCDNPLCVNPLHLSLGTHATNVADKVAKGRQSRGVSHGRSVLTEAQVGAVRMRYVKGCPLNGCRAIARELGVDASVISDVTRGLTYK